MAVVDQHARASSLPVPAPPAARLTAVPAPTAPPAVAQPARIGLRGMAAIAGLGTTQIIGWGSAFTPLMVFGQTFAADLAVPREVAFGGITVMLVVSAAISTHVGRAVGRHGARPIMMTGSVLMAIAMLTMAMSRGLGSYAFAWMLIGLGMPMAMSNTAMPGLVEVVGANARRAITALTLLSGLTSTLFLPLIAVLEARYGWRGAYLVFALLHLLVCLPIHAVVLAAGKPSTHQKSSGGAGFVAGTLPPHKRRLAFVLIAVWSCTEGMLTWGLNLQIIDVFKALGLPAAVALGVWLVTGPAQASARLVDLMLGNRFHILHAALTSAALAPLGFVILLASGVSVWGATGFCIAFGIAHGFFAIARNTLPLMLFGQREYALYLGRLSVPQNIVNAIAPVLFAAIISRVSPTAAVWLAAVSAVAGFVAVAMLVRHCREATACPAPKDPGAA